MTYGRPLNSRTSFPFASTVPTVVGGAGRTNAFGERALGDDLKCDLACSVQLGENFRLAGPGKGTDHLAYLAVANQCGEADLAVTRIVINNCEVGCAVVDQCVEQLDRAA
jgi:hypothetical protein